MAAITLETKMTGRSESRSGDDEKFVLPRSMIEEIQRTLEFYASDEFYLGPRTGGVVQGCPRGAPLNDMGRQAMETLGKLVKSYPLPRFAVSETQEAPCATCNGDPQVCATVPGLRHCEAANRKIYTKEDAERMCELAVEAYKRSTLQLHPPVPPKHHPRG